MQAAIVVPERRYVVRLDVALMDGGRVKRPLDHHVRARKPLCDIADRPLEVFRHVRGFVGLLAEFLHMQVGMQEFGIRRHCFRRGHSTRQRLVVHDNGVGRFQRDVLVARRNRGDGMALIQRFALGEHIAVDISQSCLAFAHVDELVFGIGQVVGGNDRMHAVHLLGLGRVNGANPRMRVRAAQDGTVQRAGKREVGTVKSSAGNLVRAIVTHRPGADDIECLGGQNHVGLVAVATRRSVAGHFGRGIGRGDGIQSGCAHGAVSCCIFAAAACTERTILS